MKTIKTLKIILLLAVLTLGVQLYVSAQAPPPPPNNPSEPSPGKENGVVGGSAPVGSGLVVLLTLAGAYGGYKLYKTSNEDEEEN